MIRTVGELIGELELLDPDSPIRLAAGKGWPFGYTVGAVVTDFADEAGDQGEPVVYVAVDEQVSYLPETVAGELGWTSPTH